MTGNIVVRWVVICTVLILGGWALVANPLQDQLGIDLRGGITLTYSVDRASMEDIQSESGEGQRTTLDDAMDETVQVISTRINTLGVKDLAVRREGTRRIMLQAPSMSERELSSIKSRMVQLGKLEFPIGLDGGTNDPEASKLKRLTEAGTYEPISFDVAKANEQREARIKEDWPKIREAVDAGRPIPELLYRPAMPFQYMDGDVPAPIWWKPWAPGKAAKRLGISTDEAQLALNRAREGKEYEADHITGEWLYFDPDWYYGPNIAGFSGSDISNVHRGTGRMGDRAVNYEVKDDRQAEFYDYTRKYVGNRKCLVLNDEVWSDPVIEQALSDNVQITGGSGGFSADEQDWLINCLQSGSLKLRPVLESQETVDPTLGAEAVNRGVLATIIGGLLVVVFMIFYYRFSGVVAVIALTLNLILMLALLALFEATITLPGIAGIILTIGMSVDANILIFERIREELTKGKTLVASVQAGFDRAFVTIIDANLTTVITAIILYKFGVGPIKGFAVTLMAGIATSLFTALFVSKTLFATAIRQGWISGSLNMARWVPANLRFEFPKYHRRALIASAIGVALALGVFFNSNPYGLDFTGGTTVRAVLTAPLTDKQIRDRLATVVDQQGNPRFPQVDITTLSDKTEVGGKECTSHDLQLQTRHAFTAESLANRTQPHLEEMFGEKLASTATPVQEPPGGEDWIIEVTLKEATPTSQVREMVNDWREPARQTAPYETARITAIDPQKDADGQELAERFRVRVNEKNLVGRQELMDQLAGAFQDVLPMRPDGSVDYGLAFPKVTYIGPNVVANLKQQAIISIVLSLAALIAYIWFRFREVKYGFAAAVAVFHDVIFALGAVVICNVTGLVHVPINLPILAGFLTIIGYSLNDTIVIFDRVRENLGNVKGSFGEVVNLSINQTLSRTLLTSLTTFVVVLVLFVMNKGAESPIEGIAFTLMIGIFVGTYSTIFIATPILVWLHNREEANEDAEAKAKAARRAAAKV